MSNLVQRTLTGIVFLVVLIGCIVWNEYTFGALFLLITLLSLNEFYNLIGQSTCHPQKALGLFIGGILFITNFILATELYSFKILLINVPILFLIFIHELFSDNQRPFTNIAFTFIGLIFVVVPFSLLNYIYTFPEVHLPGEGSYSLLLGSFVILWTNDVTAYIFGSWLGKNKLFERVSPKKSWEGFIGGAICSLGAGAIFSLFVKEFMMAEWIGLAAIITVFGTIGDLVESMFKRSIKIKDSGSILPGHGGLLDRFDGMLLASPFILSYIILIS